MKWKFLVAATAIAAALSAPAAANDFAEQMKAYFDATIRPALADPVIVEALKAQNQRHAALTPQQIQSMDQDWRTQARAGSGALVTEVLGTPASQALRRLKEANDKVVAEIFVMDNKGLNVAQAGLTSDYMQGDEAKWQKTYPVGPGAVFVDEVDFDESAGTFLAQISATVVDPATGQAIGAVTVGLAVENLP
jgi:hypothetical protein